MLWPLWPCYCFSITGSSTQGLCTAYCPPAILSTLAHWWMVLFLLTVFSVQCQLSREALQPLRISPISLPLPSPSFHFIHNVPEFDFISLFVFIAKISHQILSSSRARLYLSAGFPRLKALVLLHTEVRVIFSKQKSYQVPVCSQDCQRLPISQNHV